MDEIVEINDEDVQKQRQILIKLLRRYGNAIFCKLATEAEKDKEWNRIVDKMNKNGYNCNLATIKELAKELITNCDCYKCVKKPETDDDDDDAYLAINDVACIQNVAKTVQASTSNYAYLSGVGFEQTPDVVTGATGCACF